MVQGQNRPRLAICGCKTAGLCPSRLSIRQVRDDAKKLHPMLIPYEELSAVEKAYDLDMALGTLKVNA